MAGDRPYDALAPVYDFLAPEALLEPRGSFGAFREWAEDLPRGVAVLDCACGPGHLAVGLAQAGFEVTATDASPAMTSRAAALAASCGVALTVDPLTWEELPDRPWDERFAAVFCVGNSLAHAEGSEGRRRALRNMHRVLRAGGRLIITSRNWELVRASGSRIEVGDRVVERQGRRGLVIYNWTLPERWANGTAWTSPSRCSTTATRYAPWWRRWTSGRFATRSCWTSSPPSACASKPPPTTVRSIAISWLRTATAERGGRGSANRAQ